MSSMNKFMAWLGLVEEQEPAGQPRWRQEQQGARSPAGPPRPAPSHPESFTETAGTRLLIVDMDVPKILALMVILLLNVQCSQTQGTYIGN